MKKISVIPNLQKDAQLQETKRIIELLKYYGCCVKTEKKFEGQFEQTQSCANVYEDTDLLIVLGGDGSILKVASEAVQYEVPILGINLGRIGYMAEIETDELEKIGNILNGEYTIEHRMMLDVAINQNGSTIHGIALNDAVIFNGAVARIADIELRCNGKDVTRYSADGLIVATPTGSTAYSLAAGGSVVDPEMDCFCVTPVCSHSLSTRPILFSPNSVLEIKNVGKRVEKLYVTLDGRDNFALCNEESVRISRSEKRTKLVRLKDYSFYKTLGKKMCD